MDSNKNIWIGIGVVVLVVGAYLVGQSANNSSSPATSNSVEQTTGNNTAPTLSAQDKLSLASKCAQDGKAYYQSYVAQNNVPNAGGSKPVWYDPEYHFDTKLNTCLAYVGYSQEVSHYDNGLGSANFYSSDTTMHINSVVDVYSNRTVLDSFVDRTCVAQTGSDNNCTETVEPSASSGQSIGTDAFFQQKQVLMSE